MDDTQNNTNTPKPEDHYTPEELKFFEVMKEAAPQEMTNLAIIAALGNILSIYTRGPYHSHTILDALHKQMAAWHEMNETPCDCPECVEKRKREAH